jgi:hypothetical protein
VPGRRPGRAADGADQIEPPVAAKEFRTFERVGLGDPLVRVTPAVVDFLRGAVDRKAIVRKPDPVDAGQEQVAATVLADHMPWIDPAADAEVDGSLHGPCMLSAWITKMLAKLANLPDQGACMNGCRCNSGHCA